MGRWWRLTRAAPRARLRTRRRAPCGRRRGRACGAAPERGSRRCGRRRRPGIPTPRRGAARRENTRSGAPGEEGEQVELGRGEVHLLAVAADPPPLDVELDRPEPQRGARRPRRGPVHPAQQGVHPGGQLAGAERLREVVVGADRQPDHQVGLGVPSGEHQHRDRPVPLDPSAHLEAVEARQHEVEDDEVGLERLAGGHRGEPVPGDLHGEPLAAQPGRDRLGDRGFVLDHQHGAGRARRLDGQAPPTSRPMLGTTCRGVPPEMCGFGGDRPGGPEWPRRRRPPPVTVARVRSRGQRVGADRDDRARSQLDPGPPPDELVAHAAAACPPPAPRRRAGSASPAVRTPWAAPPSATSVSTDPGLGLEHGVVPDDDDVRVTEPGVEVRRRPAWRRQHASGWPAGGRGARRARRPPSPPRAPPTGRLERQLEVGLVLLGKMGLDLAPRHAGPPPAGRGPPSPGRRRRDRPAGRGRTPGPAPSQRRSRRRLREGAARRRAGPGHPPRTRSRPRRDPGDSGPELRAHGRGGRGVTTSPVTRLASARPRRDRRPAIGRPVVTARSNEPNLLGAPRRRPSPFPPGVGSGTVAARAGRLLGRHSAFPCRGDVHPADLPIRSGAVGSHPRGRARRSTAHRTKPTGTRRTRDDGLTNI